MFSPALFTVFCEIKILGTGFTARRKTIWFPLEIPPKIPPAWFVSKVIFPSSETRILSFQTEPVILALLKPSPNSMPFTAPIESIAFPSSASILSKTGSPRPAGTPSITHSIIAPALSPAFLISAIFSSIRAAASKSGARKAFSSITE